MRPPRIAIVAVGIAVIAGGLGLQEIYLRERYADAAPLPVIYRWARDVRDARVALVGSTLQYPLYGKDLSNYVQYLSVRKEHGAAVAIEDCVTWRRTLNAGRYQYVVTAANPLFPEKAPVEQRWTSTDPAATLVVRDGSSSVFRIDGRLDPAGCDPVP